MKGMHDYVIDNHMNMNMKIQKRTQVEWAFLLYFSVILTHDKIPYLKFFLWILLIALSIKNMGLKVSGVCKKNLILLFGWYGLFYAWVLASKLWAYDDRSDSSLGSTMLRIIMVVFCIGVYLTNEERIWRFLDIIVTAASYFSFVFVATSPISVWGTTEMGGITNQWRTFAANLAAMMVVFSYFAIKNNLRLKKKYIICMMINAFSVIVSGSRGAMLSLGVMLILYALFEKSVKKRFKYLLVVVLLLIIAIYLIFTNQYLYQIFGRRILAALNHQDGSAEDRSFFITIALQMFLKKPILGWGYDNFAYYIKYFEGYFVDVYSHCNYAEILSCYGIIGFILYYWAYCNIFFREWKYRKVDILAKVSMIIMIRFIIFEYSTISFSTLYYVVILSFLLCASNVRKQKGIMYES